MFLILELTKDSNCLPNCVFVLKKLLFPHFVQELFSLESSKAQAGSSLRSFHLRKSSSVCKSFFSSAPVVLESKSFSKAFSKSTSQPFRSLSIVFLLSVFSRDESSLQLLSCSNEFSNPSALQTSLCFPILLQEFLKILFGKILTINSPFYLRNIGSIE